ncbi:hypothetical protein J6590_031413 [Homalodisca vitripennis]|nr:hypothetical protein J6590_031413 [Homalodisca vitripennis]
MKKCNARGSAARDPHGIKQITVGPPHGIKQITIFIRENITLNTRTCAVYNINISPKSRIPLLLCPGIGVVPSSVVVAAGLKRRYYPRRPPSSPPSSLVRNSMNSHPVKSFSILTTSRCPDVSFPSVQENVDCLPVTPTSFLTFTGCALLSCTSSG